MKEEDRPVVLYHANCYDGFCAAWVLARYSSHFNSESSGTWFVPVNYGQDPPLGLEGRDVLIVDFSYKRPVLLELKEQARSLAVLDHHKTAREELKGLDWCVFDMDKSGARLTWEHINSKPFPPAPRLVDYTEDRDLWKWRMPNSKPVNEFIRSHPMEFKTWSYLESVLQDHCEVAVEQGGAVLRAKGQYIDVARESYRLVEIPGAAKNPFGIPVINANYSISDLLSSILSEGYPMAIAWFQRGDGKFQYSVRSTGDVDASEFARRFGGGGHKNAAGFESGELLW